MPRPSLYKDDYAEQAKKLCQLGATDDDLADFFGVSQRTINTWKIQFKEFAKSLDVGKEDADRLVKRSLYQKTQGIWVTETQAIKVKTGRYTEKVETVEVKRYIPPDTTACIFWLKNRDKDNWRDTQDHKHSAPDGGPIQHDHSIFFEGVGPTVINANSDSGEN